MVVLLAVAVVGLPCCIAGCWFCNPWWKCHPGTWQCWPCWHAWRGRRRVAAGEAVECVDFRANGVP